jgi:hypothetical protein
MHGTTALRNAGPFEFGQSNLTPDGRFMRAPAPDPAVTLAAGLFE